MVAIRQTNFSGGELSPDLWGRTDLAKHAVGLRTLTNFFVSKAGALVSRPGTEYVATLENYEQVRLIPFVYSDSQSCVIELALHMSNTDAIGVMCVSVRFISDGAYIASPYRFLDFTDASTPTLSGLATGLTSGHTGTVVSYAVRPDNTGWVELSGTTGAFQDNETVSFGGGGTVVADGTRYEGPLTKYNTTWVLGIENVQFAQSGDALIMTHPMAAPMKLSRLGRDSWSLEELSFAVPAPTFGFSANIGSPSAGDESHPPREWEWLVTELWRSATTGVVSETSPVKVTVTGAPATIAVYPDVKEVIALTGTYANMATDPNFLGYRFYRGRGGLHGWVGDCKDFTFTDVGAEPDFTLAPPQGRNPFEVLDTDGSVLRAEYPASVAYFEERLVFGNTTQRPGWLWFSATGDYFNFDERLVPVATGALSYELACRQRENVRALVGLNRLIVLTDSSAWTFGGSGMEALAAGVIPTAQVQAEIGTLPLHPLTVDGSVLFARCKGRGVNAMVRESGGDGYQCASLSDLARHLFTGPNKAVVDWCYAEDPWGVVWVVREDGVLLSLTYSRADNIWAWAEHELGGDGQAKAICSVPEGEEDAVYVAVARGVPGVTVERMTSRVRYGSGDAEIGPDDDMCLDCIHTYEGAPTTTITGLSDFEGQAVWAIATGNAPQGPYTVSGGSITLAALPTTTFVDAYDNPVVRVHVGYCFPCDAETLDMGGSEARLRQKQVRQVGFEVTSSAGLWAGQDFDHLVEWRQRTVADGYSAVSAATGLVRVPVPGNWDEKGRAVLRQTLPLPLQVVGITREMVMGDD